jgi:hypothetical protein
MQEVRHQRHLRMKVWHTTVWTAANESATIAAVERGYFLGVMRLRFEFYSFLPSSVEVKNKVSCTSSLSSSVKYGPYSLSSVCFRMAALTHLFALFVSVLPLCAFNSWTGKINLQLYLLCSNKVQRLRGEKKNSRFNRSWCHITSAFCLLTKDQPVAADLGLDKTEPLAYPSQICLLETFTSLLLSRRIFYVFAGGVFNQMTVNSYLYIIRKTVISDRPPFDTLQRFCHYPCT